MSDKIQFQSSQKKLDDLLFDPPSNPIANCSFLFCPPLNVSATACTFPSSPHSLNSRSKSSSVSLPSPPSDHFTARHTRSVCIHVRPSNRTFFCGTMPSTPRGGLGCPPAKVMVPLVMLERPARMDSVVDFPALHIYNKNQKNNKCVECVYAHPFDPSITKIPVFGISRLRFATAVTSSPPPNHDVP